MCGIYGLYTINGNSDKCDQTIIEKMQGVGRSRGPDSSGFWSNKKNVFIGHNRLSINDLSQSGSQPMYSPSKRYVIAFNGEIYNYRSLLKSLSRPLIGSSDTEVLVNLIDEFGFEYALNQIQGMYSIALYDTETNSLFLCRDKYGEKPLYYFYQSHHFSFASDLRSLVQDPSIETTINYDILPIYLSKGYIPAPLSPIKNVFKVKPAHIVRIDMSENSLALSEYEYFSKIENAA